MFRNILAVLFMIVFVVELFFCSAGNAHRKKKKLKDWNETTGRIEKIENVQDNISRRNYTELTIKTKSGSTIYSKQSPMFRIYEVGEKVELIEKDGIHRFIGNDRVNKKGVRETLIGTIPILVLVGLAALLSYLSHVL
jgi:hypothetical protein